MGADDQSHQVLELDDVIRRHAWRLLVKRSGLFRKLFLDEKDYYCEPDWRSLVMDDNVSKFDVRPPNRSYTTDWGSVKTGTKWTALHGCDFENRSDGKQSHNFRCVRETTTWVACCLDQTWSRAREVAVTLAFPTQLATLLAGRHTAVVLDKVKGSVMAETLKWDVNSQVEVQPGWRARAELLARQESHMIDFEVRTTLSLPNGVLPVLFKRKSDNSTAYEVRVYDMEMAFQSEAEGGVLKEDEVGLVHRLMEARVDGEGKSVTTSKLQLLTRGALVSVAWSDQKVDIKTAPLSVSSSENGDDGDVHTEQQNSYTVAKV